MSEEDVMLVEDEGISEELLKSLRLSASSIKTYKQCGRKFLLSRIEKEEPTHTDSAVYGWVGTIVHNAIYYSFANFSSDGAWLVQKDDDGQILVKDIDEVKTFFNHLWEGELVQQVRLLSKYEEVSLERPDFSARPVNEKSLLDLPPEEGWKTLAWNLVSKGYGIVQSVLSVDGLEEVLVEQEIVFSHLGAEFLGYIDILTRVNGKYLFFDLKTSRRPIRTPSKDIQFHLYRVGLKKYLGLPYFPVGYYVHLRSGQIYPANSFDKDVLEEMDKEIGKMIQGIHSGKFLPSLGSYLCSYCEYRGFCYSDFDTISPTVKLKGAIPSYSSEPSIFELE